MRHQPILTRRASAARRDHAPRVRVWFVLAATAVFAAPATAEETRITTVGMSGRIEQIVLPGPELEVRPLEDSRAPVVLRVTGVFPHGSAFRYDLVYYGLEPGEFDLKDCLRRKDGSSIDDLPAVRVEIRPVLPPGQVEPNQLRIVPTPRLGGYRTLAIAAGILWAIGLFALLFAWRKKIVAADGGDARPRSLADRLRPIVEAAMTGTISRGQRAELERLLLTYWRRRLNLDKLRPGDAIAKLREHEESSPLLRQLEIWLHRPGPRDAVDVTSLLRPYQDLPADAI